MIGLNLASRASIFGICAFALILYLASDTLSTSLQHLTSRAASSSNKMATSLPQISIRPAHDAVSKDQKPEVKVTVENPSDSPVTLLKWNTVLDTLAPSLGVFQLRDLTANEDVELNIMMVRRQLPAKESDLVEIEANGTIETTVTFQSLELKCGHKYSVQATGFWQAVWNMSKADVVSGHLDQLSGGANGDFASNTVEFSQVFTILPVITILIVEFVLSSCG
ncbi:uncharacterized protein GIQ15_02972 [Arthroderma uncinatum]|uniref:uncharacterized protein n=1 Tax=Arthroderma uncinatum TaxID=74035 RepID=UPI00144A5910|nr:uncharacterized protein GIQ15_02972 [Arthroderma uncinatum]KAF3483648.1 hypothetical protein GIQ15_02972 [Arthroderma uncinatum]